MAAAAAFAWAAGGGPADGRRGARARGASRGGELAGERQRPVLVGRHRRADPVREPAGRRRSIGRRASEAYRRGSRFSTSSLELFEGAYLLLAVGDLAEGGEAVRQRAAAAGAVGLRRDRQTRGRAGCVGLQAVLTGDPARARAALGAPPPSDEESDGANLWRRTQAEMLLAEGQPAEALELAELMGRTAPHVLHPDWKPWQSLKARALAQLGRREEAIAAMEARARAGRAACGGAASIGRCLRQLGELEGDAGEAHLSEAVELLSGIAGAARARPRARRARRPAAPDAAPDRGARAAAPGARAGRGVRAARRSSRGPVRALRGRRAAADGGAARRRRR